MYCQIQFANIFLRIFASTFISNIGLSFSFYFLVNLFILFILFLAALRLCCCARAFSSCGEQGLLFIAVCGFLTAVASLVVEHGL